MTSQQKKITVAVLLGIVWAGLLAWQFSTWKEPARVPLSNVSGAGVATRHVPKASHSLQVRLDLLAASRTRGEMEFAAPRNIFTSPLPVGSVPGRQEPVSDLALQQQAVAAELSQFHYLGYVLVGEDWQKKPRLAVLTRQDDLHVVKRGEIVDKHILVKAISDESVTLQDRPTRVEYRVLLSEEPVMPGMVAP